MVFVLLALLAAGILVAMAAGRLRVDSEWPGLVAGGVLIAVFLLALRRA
jgi:hypothetical protein